MLQWAQTPIAPGRPSPAQIHFGRNLRDDLHNRVEQSAVAWEEIKQWKEASREAVARGYNRGSRELETLTVGTEVFVLCREVWRTGVISRVLEKPRAYAVKLHDSGRTIQQNRKFLRVNSTGVRHVSAQSFDQSLLIPEFQSASESSQGETAWIPVAQTSGVSSGQCVVAADSSTVQFQDGASRTQQAPRRMGLWDRQQAFLEKPKVTKSGRVVQLHSKNS